MRCSNLLPPASVVGLLVLLLLAPAVEARKKKDKTPQTEEDVRIVDCLLRGEVRQLGRRMNYVTQRRPVRTTAIDCEIRGGEYTAYDRSSYAASLEHWLPAASSGDPEAQTFVGQIFERGLDGTPDYASAALWYRRAAEQGYARAQADLAHLYEEGLGVPKDPAQAILWWSRAAGRSEEQIQTDQERAAALAQELADLTAAQAATEQQLEDARRDLEASQAAREDLARRLRAAESSAGDATRELEELRGALQEQEEAVEQRREALRAEERRKAEILASMSAARRGVAEARRGQGVPTLEIVRPDVLATRGPAVVPVPTDQEVLEVSGRVTAPAGLSSLTADGATVAPDPRGLFKTRLPFSGARREVRFVATDRAGQEARVTLVLQPAAAGTASVDRGSSQGPTASAALPRNEQSHYHALVLGAAEYEHLEPLATAREDAEDVAAILARKYGFKVRLLHNPRRWDVLSALNSLRETLGPEDRLLIYYAGHGKIEGAGPRGYWIPVDAPADDPERWLSNETISNYLEIFEAGHILVISDSCYSGTLTRTQLPTLARELATSDGPTVRSRYALTSGGLQPVLDTGAGGNSLFANALLRVLRLYDQEVEVSELFQQVHLRVTFAASELGFEQTPEYAPIHHTGHEGGEMLLRPVAVETQGATSSAARRSSWFWESSSASSRAKRVP